MLIPYDWLTEYVDTEGYSPQEIAAKLTASGTSIERIQIVGEGLDELIVAEVLEVYPHPNADRLRLAKVNTGSEVFEVVCGAPNLAAGQRIVFAPVGATVPVDMHSDDRGPFTLTRATIRGVVSNGMICSVAEMGLGEEHGGILVLPTDATVGQSAAEALGYPRAIFDAEVTTNRPDELSMVGVAREVGALINRPLRLPSIEHIDTQAGEGCGMTIESDNCWRLMAQTLKVTVKPSPNWMQERLAMAGMRPINSVVDITNYVMLELGQPMHVYDRARLTGDKIVARQARTDETIVTLDGVGRTLLPDMLIIADQQPIGVAGIMGGQASMIDESSTEIVLEAACFDPVAVRRAANALALRSEASKRFERGVDPETTELALRRAVNLLLEYADAELVGGPQDEYKHRPEPITVSLSAGKLNQYLGKEFDLNQAEKILEKLGFNEIEGRRMKDDDEELDKSGSLSAVDPVLGHHERSDGSPLELLDDARPTKNDKRSFSVPSWRLRDVEEEVDLIEEVVRMVGYDALPVGLAAGQQPNVPINHFYSAVLSSKRRLAQAGWLEVINLSLTDAQAAGREAVAISNPLSSEWTHMRTALLPGLLATARGNARRQPDLQLFELSKIYMPAAGLPNERHHVALVSAGKASVEIRLMQLKGLIQLILQDLAVRPGQIEYRPGCSNPLFDNRGSGHIVIDDNIVGLIGRLAPSAEQAYDLDDALVAELDIEQLLRHAASRQFEPLPKFPGVEEDLSLLMDEELPVGPVVALVTQVGGEMVAEVRVVSMYRDAKLGDDKKSPLLHIVYRAADRTLSSQEIADVRQQIVDALKREGVDVRE